MSGDIMTDEFADILRYWGCDDNVCPKDVRKACETAGEEGLVMYVNSDGGSLIAGTEIYSVLREYGRAEAHIQSRAASSATVAIMGCSRIVAEAVSLICIHNPSSYVSGDAEVMRRTAEELDNVKAAILAAYAGRADLSKKDLSALMDRDIWIPAERAKEYGLIDDILPSPGHSSGSGINSGVRSGEIVNAGGRVFFPT